MALLGIGFAWPILFIFIVPLIVASILARMGFGPAAPVLIAVSLSITFGASVSLYYWRYPFQPPPVLRELRDVAQLHQLSSFYGLNAKSTTAASAMAAIPPPSALEWNTPGGLMPTQRILQEFGKRNISISSYAPISADQLASIWHAADAANLLLDGSPDRLNTKTLNGYAGTATLRNGTEITFAAVMGGEYSNDHYPYYEIVLEQGPDDLVITNSLWFFEDIAGLEGMKWLNLALLGFVVLLPATLMIWSIYAKRLTRRCS